MQSLAIRENIGKLDLIRNAKGGRRKAFAHFSTVFLGNNDAVSGAFQIATRCPSAGAPVQLSALQRSDDLVIKLRGNETASSLFL
jgi:hypothetical protein